MEQRTGIRRDGLGLTIDEYWRINDIITCPEMRFPAKEYRAAAFFLESMKLNLLCYISHTILVLHHVSY